MRIARNRYLDQLIARKGNGLVKIVTGIRRCGKSYLLMELFHEHLLACGVPEDHIVEVALDDRRNRHLRDPDAMLAYLDAKVSGSADSPNPYYVVIDEVQLLDEFVDVLNSLLHMPNVDVYVSGSNSRFLATDVVTEFRGRGDQIRLHPLSFSEYCAACGGSSAQAWSDYLVYGGMPLVLSRESPREKAAYLQGLFEEVYLVDIVDRYGLRNAPELGELVDVLASSVGSLTNPTRIANTFASEKGLPIGNKTVSRYIDYLRDAFLISEAKRYDVKGRVYINSPSKYYYEDVGLRNARLNFRQVEESRLMENVIYNELVARGYSVDVGVVDTYGRNSAGKTERIRLGVDFVANRGSARCYIQSALNIDTPEKAEQEKRSLKKVGDGFQKLLIVRDEPVAHYDPDGIFIMGVHDFLLDPESLERLPGV